MELGLDNWTAEFLSEELVDRDDLGMMTLRQAIDLYAREKLSRCRRARILCRNWDSAPAV